MSKPMKIEKVLGTRDGELTVLIQDDEDTPVVLQTEGGDYELSQENVKALKAWLDASLKLQRWC